MIWTARRSRTATRSPSRSAGPADYSIDLSKANADKFEKAIGPYLEKAQRVGGQKSRPSSAPRAQASQVDTKAVRAWAASNGIELSSRGRVQADVIEKYKAAGN